MPVHYIYLLIAIMFEVAGTSMLQISQQFTKPLPSLGVVIGYAGAFYFMSLTLKFMPIGIVYALWSGLGIVLIITGVVVIQLFSKTATH